VCGVTVQESIWLRAMKTEITACLHIRSGLEKGITFFA